MTQMTEADAAHREKEMLQIYDDAAAIGYEASGFRGLVASHRPLRAAKMLINMDDPSHGGFREIAGWGWELCRRRCWGSPATRGARREGCRRGEVERPSSVFSSRPRVFRPEGGRDRCRRSNGSPPSRSSERRAKPSSFSRRSPRSPPVDEGIFQADAVVGADAMDGGLDFVEELDQGRPGDPQRSAACWLVSSSSWGASTIVFPFGIALTAYPSISQLPTLPFRSSMSATRFDGIDRRLANRQASNSPRSGSMSRPAGKSRRPRRLARSSSKVMKPSRS